MFRNVKIAAKIFFMVLFISLFTLLLITVISYTQMLGLTKYSQDANIQLGITSSRRSRDALIRQAQEYLDNIAAKQAEGSDAMFRQVNTEITALTEYVERLYANPEGFTGKPVPFVLDAPPETPGAKYMYAPGVAATPAVQEELRRISSAEYAFSGIFKNNSLLHNIYLGTESGISYRYSAYTSFNPSYDPRERSWYKASMENKEKTIWIDTYVDAYGIVTVTCARAFRNGAGVYGGAVATDVLLTEIIKTILALRIGRGGYAFLLDREGAYIAHPRYGEEGFNTDPLEDAVGPWREALERMIAGVHRGSIVEMYGEERYLTTAPLQETGWTLGVCIPIKEVAAPAQETQEDIAVFTNDAQRYIRDTLSWVLIRFIIIFAVLAILVVTFSYILSTTITQPIEELTKTVNRIRRGDLNTVVKVRGKDEIADLGAAFNKMTVDLKAYIRNLNRVTAEKERINGELTVASNIQMNMLPRIFPDFEDNRLFELYGKMEAAKQVGGDFYDFFYLDGNKTKLALIIADVSGKGVPAALFMVIAKTLLKTHLLNTAEPAEAMTKVNGLLCEDNEMCMFVTVFTGVMDLETGDFTFANAGHNPPLLAQNKEEYRFLEVASGVPLAVAEDFRYQQSTIPFRPGDRLCLYTDGLSEAENTRGDRFGNERLLETVNAYRDLTPKRFDDSVRKALSGFVDGAEQFDDITVLTFLYTGRQASP
ncbi:MAG: SpoIIE family protein phosphatase [Spirochaetaceae bacterium]|jgi:sigma-B regulation protein RsbU (phosphoserine phosphatase)|nr:SpoIIE family protein phosphatase [Spirochaetaceae bacterium]